MERYEVTGLIKQLTRLRENNRLTKTELAKIGYVHRSALKGWELGTRRPLLENIETLFAALGYVLVPVPTQLQEEVKTLIQQRLTENASADTLASFGEDESELRATSQAEN